MVTPGPEAEIPLAPGELDGPFTFFGTTTRTVSGTDPAAPSGAVEPVAGSGIVRSVVELHYGTGSGLELTERVELPFELPDTSEVARATRLLHLVAGVSYYKSVAPTRLVTGPLDDPERRLVTALYDDGLREFAYRNGLRVPLPVELDERDGERPTQLRSAGPDGQALGPTNRRGSGADPDRGGRRSGPVERDVPRALVPIGGGKDSALVASLIPEGMLFAVNPVPAHQRLADALGRPLLAVRRHLDPALRDLVRRGAPNGHVPVTAITSAIAVLVAAALGLDDVLMGIERSADEPSLVTPDGVAVNHQFSKSMEAERLLRTAFEPVGVRYLSLLRPLSELAIGTAVAHRGLADDIVSCNRVFTVWNENTSSREQRPCGECAKCLFTALMVAPASSPAAVAERYGRALLDDPDHVEAVRELWSDAKPFDCVGERLESAAAVVLLSRTPGWSDQAVIAALAAEAAALLAAAGVEPVELLRIGDVDGLPEQYRALISGLAPDLEHVPGVAGAAR